jgi:DNA-binding NarL/FixJ family response regulator
MRIVLVDDQADFRTGLRDLLAGADGIEVVGEASDGREAAAIVLNLLPDITLMDIRMPICDGIAATQAIHAKLPDACVLVLTTFDDDALVRDAMRAGAAGYLLKGMPIDDMLAVFRLALRGYTTIGRGLGSAAVESVDRSTQLSEREREVWALLGEGYTNRQIAERLFITEGTVKNYVSNLLAALGLRHRTEAALLWRKARA